MSDGRSRGGRGGANYIMHCRVVKVNHGHQTSPVEKKGSEANHQNKEKEHSGKKRGRGILYSHPIDRGCGASVLTGAVRMLGGVKQSKKERKSSERGGKKRQFLTVLLSPGDSATPEGKSTIVTKTRRAKRG